jgi:modification methylase
MGAHVQGLEACNGWTFWQFPLPDGGYAPIDMLRQRLRAELS